MERGEGDVHTKIMMMVDWDVDKLISAPVFWRKAVAGHWGRLVINRWAHPGGLPRTVDDD